MIISMEAQDTTGREIVRRTWMGVDPVTFRADTEEFRRVIAILTRGVIGELCQRDLDVTAHRLVVQFEKIGHWAEVVSRQSLADNVAACEQAIKDGIA